MITVVAALAGCASAPAEPELEPTPLDELVRRTPAPQDTEDAGAPTIRRAALDVVLERSPGWFLRRMPVEPARIKRRFVGYRILALFRNARATPGGLRVGDIVLAVNGVGIKKPSHLMRVWKGLKRADRLDVDVLRGGQRVRVSYAIVP